uniref:Dihydrolipoyl dehydrogenase n=1 Tax=Chenopodium quinoa TaxID=63459 RepID=A0A803KU80_CHEQI
MAMSSIARRKSTLLSKNLCSSTESLRYTLSLSSFSRYFSSGSDDNDVVVIGGGPGGYVAAIKAAQLGLKTTCIEKRGALGGTCLNALLHSSHMYHEAKHAFASHGVKFSSVEVDLPAMMGQKDKAVANLTRGIEGLFKKNKVKYVKGYGKFVSPSEVSVDTLEGENTVVKGKHIIVATGSDVKSLPGVTIDEQKIVSSTGALALKEIPKRLVVIGAGYIGLEMGSVWGRLGSEVTVVEFASDIVPSMDGEVRKQFQRSLEKQGMKFKLKTKVVSVDTSGDGVKLTVEPSAGGEQTILEADVVLVSAGRVPFTSGLGLENLGVEMDKAGRILVNERFSTNVSGVYAIGDVIPGPMLAHKAEEDGVACVEFIAGKHGHVDYDLVPGVCYTHPEVASVGKTEEQVKTLGVEYRVGKFPFMANSRAKAIDNAEGLVKILAEKESDKILGVHIMAPNAGELIHEAVLALQYGASSEDIARTCHAHPTMSEALKEAAMATYDKAIHI